MGQSTSELQFVLSAKDDASKVIQGLGSTISGFGGALKTVAKTAGIAFAAVGTAAVAFGASSVKAYVESEKEMAKFNATMKTMGKIGEESREKILGISQSMVKLGFDDEATANTMAMFMQRTKDVTKAQDLLQVSMDLSRAKSIDLDTASKMVNLTLSGNGRALKAYGIELKEGQDPLKALAELQKKVAGQTEAYAETTQGKLDIAKTQWENIKENVGAVLVEKLKLNEALGWVNEKLAWLQTVDFAGYWNRAKDAIIGFKDAVIVWYNEFFNDANWIWVFIKDFFLPIILSMRDTFVSAWEQIKAALEPIMPVLEYLAMFFGVIIVGALMIFIKIWEQVWKMGIAIVVGFVNMFSGTIQFLQGLFSALASAIYGDWSGVVDGLKMMWDGFVTFIKGIAEVLFSPLITNLKTFEEAFNKTINWIKEKWNETVKFFKDNPVTRFFKDDNDSDGKKSQFGNPIQAGRATIVGEHRPEVFVPSQSGNIRQLDQVGMGKSINVNFNNVSVRSNSDLEYIVAEVKRVLSREQELSRMGAY